MPVPPRVVYMGSDQRVRSFAFTLLLEGADPLTEEHLDALFLAGCDDATFGQRGSVYYADFDRPATSFAEAVDSAIARVESAVPGLKVVRVEPDDLVSAADIAERVHRSREGIRLLIDGKRGPGGFPQPALWLGGKRPLWRWSDVEVWWTTFLGEPKPGTGDTDFIAALNGAFDVRRRAGLLTGPRERAVVARIVREDAELLRP